MRIALVLGSGSAKGYAHIGVIKELKARGHTISAISGASMGAVIGGLEAAGGLDAFTEWALGLSQFDVLRYMDVTLGHGGVMKAIRIVERLDEFCDSARIEDLPIPYTAVATDITARREVWFQRGPLAAAMRASMAIPGVITPVLLGDHVLVDGGVLNPVPVEPTLGVPCDVTVAVALHGRSDALGVSLIADADAVEAADSEEPAEEALVQRLAARLTSRFSRQAKGAGEEDNSELVAELEALEEELARASEPADIDEGMPADGTEIPGEEGTLAASGALSSADVVAGQSRASVPQVMDMALTTMEDALERVRAAVAPPHLRIEVPDDICGSFEFHRASEVIDVGQALAVEAFDRVGL